ncbi:redoxin family protein [Rhodobacteraceae bacterium D3-12]|nr:redoxin family protein [Rhodobacteraceae bacterium D3-12]
MTSRKLAAGSAFPAITLPMLGRQPRDISRPGDGFDWMLIVVYRGKHCPLCTRYLQQLNDVLPDLNALGVDVVAVSADSETRATSQMAEVSPAFGVAYGLTVPQMQGLGLYISDPRNGTDVEAPFAEPGLFVLNEDRVLQITDISNVPFARPDLTWIAKGIGFRRGPMKAAPVNGTYA